MTAPLESVTTPVMDARSWAWHGRAKKTSERIKRPRVSRFLTVWGRMKCLQRVGQANSSWGAGGRAELSGIFELNLLPWASWGRCRREPLQHEVCGASKAE